MQNCTVIVRIALLFLLKMAGFKAQARSRAVALPWHPLTEENTSPFLCFLAKLCVICLRETIPFQTLCPLNQNFHIHPLKIPCYDCKPKLHEFERILAKLPLRDGSSFSSGTVAFFHLYNCNLAAFKIIRNQCGVTANGPGSGTQRDARRL